MEALVWLGVGIAIVVWLFGDRGGGGSGGHRDLVIGAEQQRLVRNEADCGRPLPAELAVGFGLDAEGLLDGSRLGREAFHGLIEDHGDGLVVLLAGGLSLGRDQQHLQRPVKP